MLIDEAAHLGRSASSSLAKNTDAALRISFRAAAHRPHAQRRDLLPLGRRRQIPPQTLIDLHLLHIPAQRLRRHAQIAPHLARSGRPLSITTRARSNSQGGYLRGPGIDGSSTYPRTDHPGVEVCRRTQPGSFAPGAVLAGAVFGGDEPDVLHELPGARDALEVVDCRRRTARRPSACRSHAGSATCRSESPTASRRAARRLRVRATFWFGLFTNTRGRV